MGQTYSAALRHLPCRFGIDVKPRLDDPIDCVLVSVVWAGNRFISGSRLASSSINEDQYIGR